MVDRRDEQTWVTLELTALGQQKIEEGTLEDDILEALGAPFHWPIFVPARTYQRGKKTVTVHLMEGYAFVGTGFDEQRYFALERTASKLVAQVMSVDTADGIRVLHTIPDHHVQGWKEKLKDEIASDIREGMNVRITDGKLCNLEGEVVSVRGEYADVLVKLRSRHIITSHPRYCLDVV